jgi:radical SAM superfamily enzyme YgiQ (UPF0313 family)
MTGALPLTDLVCLRFGRGRRELPPVGPLSLAGSLQAAGGQWRLHDTQADPQMGPSTVDRLCDVLRATEGEALGISLFNDAVPLVVAALERLGGEMGRRRVLLGGPGVVGIAPRLLDRLPGVEAVVVGEAEAVLPALLRSPPGAMVGPGVLTRGVRPRLKARTDRADLDELPPMPWEWCRGRGYSLAPLWTMRGCPFACQFCDVEQLTGRKVTKRDLEASLADMERAVEMIGSRRVQVLDDTFTLSEKRVLEFCRRLEVRRLGVKLQFFSRTDTFGEAVMEALARAGGREVSFGIDAGDDAILGRISKGIRLAEAERTIVRASRYLDVAVNIVWGYPFESLEQFENALRFCRRVRDRAERFAVLPQLHLLQPSVGTTLFEQHQESLVFGRPAEGADAAPRIESGTVREIMRGDRWLGAAHHRYQTPAFEEKLRLLEGFLSEQGPFRPLDEPPVHALV